MEKWRRMRFKAPRLEELFDYYWLELLLDSRNVFWTTLLDTYKPISVIELLHRILDHPSGHVYYLSVIGHLFRTLDYPPGHTFLNPSNVFWTFLLDYFKMNEVNLCRRNKGKCTKPLGHSGGCNKRKEFTFYVNSPVLKKKNLDKEIDHLEGNKNELQITVDNLQQEKDALQRENNILRNQLDAVKIANQNLMIDNISTREEHVKLHEKYKKLAEEYKNLDLLFEPRNHSKTQRELNPTTNDMTSDISSSTRYNRRKETKTILEYLHGGADGAILGAWDFIQKHASSDKLESLILDLKKGLFIDKLNGKFNRTFAKSETAMNQAVASKYKLFLSRRKFTFLCKVQARTFDPESQKWSGNIVSYGDKVINLNNCPISNGKVDNFVKKLDIGELHTIPGRCGVTRTVTALVSMIIDLHLRSPSLRSQLHWFNDAINHFIFQFSDDGAPESKEETMCIGSLSCWNFGKRIRSRDYHYPIHMVSATEKDSAVADLWKQHSEEMLLLEGNTLTINNEKISLEFQPSADQAWQAWANNELSQAATYPSMFAKVHKSELAFIGGSIGGPDAKWPIPTTESRDSDLKKLNEFRNELTKKNQTAETFHKHELAYMADNGLRQFGEPRIGIYANLQRPEPLHLEVNNWQHLLYVMYLEALHKGKIEEFLCTLGAPVTAHGCGLKFVAGKVRDHYNNTKERFNVIKCRLIGAQAISLAKFSLRLIDAIHDLMDTQNQKLRLTVLSKLCQTLRKIGTLINQVFPDINCYVIEIKQTCMVYFNLFAIYFTHYCNVTVWTMGYIVPYAAEQLWETYKIGYGIISMQGKESKNSATKTELKQCSNRSVSNGEDSKWHQLARGSFVRNFYLPYHFNMDSYVSHFDSRIPSVNGNVCSCFRVILDNSVACDECFTAADILVSAMSGNMPDRIVHIIKPITCEQCGERFNDNQMLLQHLKVHVVQMTVIVPRNLSVVNLKKELAARGLSTNGSKIILCSRLEENM